MPTSKTKRPKRTATDVLADRCGNVLYVKQSIWPKRPRVECLVPMERPWEAPIVWPESDDPPDAIRYSAMILIRLGEEQWELALIVAPDDIRERFDKILAVNKMSNWHVLMQPVEENEPEAPLLCNANLTISSIKDIILANMSALALIAPALSPARRAWLVKSAMPPAEEMDF